MALNQNLYMLAGFAIEKKILEELQQVYRVVSTANIRTNGQHGPRLESNQDHTTLADSMIFGERRGWIEIKAKSEANYRRDWQRFEHGIDHNKFIEYCDLQVKTGMPVYIMVCESETHTILMCDVDTLRASGKPRIGTWPDGKKSINWDRKVFTTVGSFKVPDNDLTRMRVEWDRGSLGKFMSQLDLQLDGSKSG